MSLDVYLDSPSSAHAGSGIFIREDGKTRQFSREEWDRRFPSREPVVVDHTDDDDDHGQVYWANITHNLGKMAVAADIYQHLWRPDEIGITHAAMLIEPLTAGLAKLRADPAKFRALNPPNGWGSYEDLMAFVEAYLNACKANSDATVRVWR